MAEKKIDYAEKMRMLNEVLSKSFRIFLEPNCNNEMGHYLTLDGERYKTTNRGDLSINMPDSRLYDALYAYLFEDGEKPDLRGEVSLVIEKHCELTGWRVKWELLSGEYGKRIDDDTIPLLTIDFIRWGGKA